MVVVARAVVFLVFATAAVACGRDVDLGGATDAGAASAVDACPCTAITADGATHDPCGLLAPPPASATCRACDSDSPTCQENGCYGGYWCNVGERDCKEPPAACP